MVSAYQLEIDFTLLVGQLILFLALLAFEAVFDLWIAPKLLQNGWLPGGSSQIMSPIWGTSSSTRPVCGSLVSDRTRKEVYRKVAGMLRKELVIFGSTCLPESAWNNVGQVEK